jgi:rhamnosyl/mannosyltransferase
MCQHFSVIAIGRLTYYKGFDILIQAAAKLEGVNIAIVGEGEQRSLLEQKIKEFHVEDKVTLCGHLSSDELYQKLRAADCLCLPSIERTEAFGLVLLEAMACDVPVIVSDVPGSGMSWLVSVADNGVIVPAGNVGKLSEAIDFLKKDKKQAGKMALAGKKTFEETFHINKVAEQVMATYQSLKS